MGRIAALLSLFTLVLVTESPAGAGYPEGFSWGVAISAHQTEGKSGGGENGDWWRFEHSLPAPITDGDTADVADDHWNRYPEDFQLAHDLGVDTMRISVAWEKIEPAPGKFSDEAIQHYRAVLQSMHEHGIRPMVALHHFTHPIWFADAGGWLADSSPERFLEYATFVVSNLGDLCDLWVTFNEPMVVVGMGYLNGQVPPNHRSFSDAVKAALNLARAHRMSVARIHELQPKHAGFLGGVGIVNSLQLYRAKHAWNPLEWISAGIAAEFSNWAFLDTILEGKGIHLEFQDANLGIHDSGWQTIPKTDLLGLSGSPLVDWLGVNYYTEYQLHLTWDFKIEVLPPKGPVADNGWGIFPSGLERIVRQTASRYPGIPLVVSENGLADASDQFRPQFLRDSMQALDRLVLGTSLHDPLDVRGYFHWSLMDNFEWLQGRSQRFGLVEIRYDQDLKRVPRESFNVYREELGARRKPGG